MLASESVRYIMKLGLKLGTKPRGLFSPRNVQPYPLLDALALDQHLKYAIVDCPEAYFFLRAVSFIINSK
jgi:hypothetical protein